MKIVHCIWSFHTGGAETMLVDIANEQAKTQNVTIIIVNDSYQKYLIDKLSPKVKVIFIHRNPGSRSLWPIIKLNWTLMKLLPDVVHMHNAMLPQIIFSFASRGLFLTVHALHISLRCVRRGLKLIAISEAVKEDVLSRGNYDIITIQNGINVDAIAKKDMPPAIQDGKMRIIQVGRLEASKKGQDILINAVAVLQNRGVNNIDVDFIGTGESEMSLKQLSEEKGVTDKIHFLGLRDRDYIYSHLKDYDLMCHPSRYEGFGLTVAEGMAAMLPVLVSNEGGPFEIINYGEFGTAFKMENVEDCADKIEYIYKNYNDVSKLIPIAYKHIHEQYSVEGMVKNYIKIYKDELDEKQ